MAKNTWTLKAIRSGVASSDPLRMSCETLGNLLTMPKRFFIRETRKVKIKCLYLISIHFFPLQTTKPPYHAWAAAMAA